MRIIRPVVRLEVIMDIHGARKFGIKNFSKRTDEQQQEYSYYVKLLTR